MRYAASKRRYARKNDDPAAAFWLGGLSQRAAAWKGRSCGDRRSLGWEREVRKKGSKRAFQSANKGRRVKRKSAGGVGGPTSASLREPHLAFYMAVENQDKPPSGALAAIQRVSGANRRQEAAGAQVDSWTKARSVPAGKPL